MSIGKDGTRVPPIVEDGSGVPHVVVVVVSFVFTPETQHREPLRYISCWQFGRVGDIRCYHLEATETLTMTLTIPLYL